LSRQALAEVINARYEELFALVQEELRRSGFESLVAAGIVLTGGASKVQGAAELAESVFNMPVRLGSPQHVSGLTDVLDSPSYATGVGLLIYGQKQQQNEAILSKGNNQSGLWARMKRWFQGNF
jgi:cell division protein FtsA